VPTKERRAAKPCPGLGRGTGAGPRSRGCPKGGRWEEETGHDRSPKEESWTGQLEREGGGTRSYAKKSSCQGTNQTRTGLEARGLRSAIDLPNNDSSRSRKRDPKKVWKKLALISEMQGCTRPDYFMARRERRTLCQTKTFLAAHLQ